MILQEMNYDYEIAGFVLRTEGPAADLGGIEGFGVFRTSTAKKPDITLRTGVAIAGPDDLSDLEFLHSQEFEGIECTLYRRGGDTYFFRMSSPEYGTVSFLHAAGSSVFDCDAGTDGKRPAPIIMRFLVWTAFGMAAVRGGGVSDTLLDDCLRRQGRVVSGRERYWQKHPYPSLDKEHSECRTA